MRLVDGMDEEAVMNAIQGFGPKCDRLLAIRRMPALAEFVPPLLPIAPLSESALLTGATFELRLSAYAEALRKHLPRLVEETSRICGNAPWIVRSSGDEDSEDNVNAGGYDSVACEIPDRLYACVAQVALSGFHQAAREQLSLIANDGAPEPIASFVQPLLDVMVDARVEPEQAPYLPGADVAQLEEIGRTLIDAFGMDAIDCEWGIATDAGFVSVTTILPRDSTAMTGYHALGFGFASAQMVTERPTSTVLRPAGTQLRLWRGAQLRHVLARGIHLLQARPAALEPAYREVPLLSEAARAELDSQYAYRQAALLFAGSHDDGHFIAAPTLATAWRRYLALDPARRQSLALVLVDEGSAAEHAGIMFRQQKLGCAILDTASIPPGSSIAAFDRDRCYLGDASMLGRVHRAPHRLLSLPSDCHAVFMSEEFGRTASDADALLNAMDQLLLEPEQRETLLARSRYPDPTLWLESGGRVCSPSLLELEIERGGLAAIEEPPFANRYREAAALSRTWFETSRLSGLDAPRQAIQTLAKSADLRLALTLLDYAGLTHATGGIPLAPILRCAASRLDGGDRRGARLMLQALLSLDHSLRRLPFYSDRERLTLLTELSGLLASGAEPETVRQIEEMGLAPTALLRLAAAASKNDDLRRQASEFAAARAHLVGAATDVDAGAAARRLREAFAVLADERHGAELEGVRALLWGALIETYDATLKAILGGLVVDFDSGTFRRYLDVMLEWIALARTHGVSTREEQVLCTFQAWLVAWRDEPVPDDYSIEDRNWRVEFEAIASGSVKRYENPHVLHNLLHQWMLASNRIDAALLPERLRELHHFCSTFSSRATKVLRFEAALFEVEIPMGTHKVSFAIGPDAVTIEWAEPPDCPDAEIARILAFEAVLDRYRHWWFDTLSWRREKIVGTWSLLIRLNAPLHRPWQFGELRHIVTALRLLFDSTYDFSYVENDAVDGFAESLADDGWRMIFERMRTFRDAYDDTAQFVFLHAVPLSSMVATLAQSGLARGLVRRCARDGFDASMRLADMLAGWLDEGDDPERWSRRYELLRVATLFIAAAWPERCIDTLAETPSLHAGHDLMASCVLRRTDTRDRIGSLLRLGHLDGFTALVLRHTPEQLLDANSAPELAAATLRVPKGYRRAKQLMVACFARSLDDATLAALLADLDTVPTTSDLEQEHRISAATLGTGQRLRFDLARGVEWTALDSWRAERRRGATAGSSPQLEAEV